MTIYVAVLPDGREHVEEVSPPKSRLRFVRGPYQIAMDFVRKVGLTTPRSRPTDVLVKVFTVKVKDGEMVRELEGDYMVQLPLDKMTGEDYEAAMAEIVEDLPDEFKTYVRDEAYDRGHSSGYEECYSIGQDMAGKLAICVNLYTTRLTYAAAHREKRHKRSTKK